MANKLFETLKDIEKKHIVKALRFFKNETNTAKGLGIARSTLWRKMKLYKIEIKSKRTVTVQHIVKVTVKK